MHTGLLRSTQPPSAAPVAAGPAPRRSPTILGVPHGYGILPDDPDTVGEARANPGILAKKTLKQVADHTTDIIRALDRQPVVMGRSTGGLLAQMLAGRGLSAATVAIDPGVFRGVLPLPASVLRGRPLPGQPAHARPRDHPHVRP